MQCIFFKLLPNIHNYTSTVKHWTPKVQNHTILEICFPIKPVIAWVHSSIIVEKKSSPEDAKMPRTFERIECLLKGVCITEEEYK